jgi:hypothetical protein
MNEMSILPVQLTRMIRTFGGICMREVPAKSAPAYEHQLQQNATIRGSKEFFVALDFALVVTLDLGLVEDKHGPPLIFRGVKFDAIKLP